MNLRTLTASLPEAEYDEAESALIVHLQSRGVEIWRGPNDPDTIFARYRQPKVEAPKIGILSQFKMWEKQREGSAKVLELFPAQNEDASRGLGDPDSHEYPGSSEPAGIQAEPAGEF